MGALRKAGVWLGLIEDDDYTAPRRYQGRGHDLEAELAELEDLEDDDEDFTEPPARNGRFARRDADSGTDRADRVHGVAGVDHGHEDRLERTSVRTLGRYNSPASRVPADDTLVTHNNLALAPQVQLRERAVETPAPAAGQRITTLHPTTYNEARAIGEHFRDGVPVIMNLSEMEEADAKRLVDFAAGLAFGLRGTIERVTNRVFLLSPANVTVTAEDKARIVEGGFFDQE